MGQCCPCEASDQKMGQKPKAKRNEIELSFLHHSIRLDELINLVVSNVKIPIQSWGKSGVLAYFALKIGYFGHIF